MDPRAERLIEWRHLCTGLGLDRAKFGAVSINEAIAAADRFSAVALADSKENDSLANWARQYKELARVYTWFRDRQRSQTVAEVLDALEQRRIDPGVVRLLVYDVKDLPGVQLRIAAKKGYPEFAEAIDSKSRETVEESLERTQRIIDAM